MMGPAAALRKNGTELHLQHGPIDLLIQADGPRRAVFEAAHKRFQTVLQELVDDLTLLRAPLTSQHAALEGQIARYMQTACQPFESHDLTPMICVAGAVADTVLEAMTQADPQRAYVNNGGDIALHLTPGTRFKTAIVRHDGHTLGQIEIKANHPVRGIATSGWRGRSHSLGIADSVTVLAHSAAAADVAATLIANAVDLPGHPIVRRTPACDLSPDSDLGDRLVTVDVGRLSDAEITAALEVGRVCAQDMHRNGQIVAAALFLGDQVRLVGGTEFFTNTERALAYA